MRWNNPDEFKNEIYGKKIDVDNYPNSNPYQCWDILSFFVRQNGLNGQMVHCGVTGYVKDVWLTRKTNPYHILDYFEEMETGKFQKGDFIFFSETKETPYSHVGMMWDGGYILGQNQPVPYVTLAKLDTSQAYGGLRWKGWSSLNIECGASDVEVNGRTYHLYRQKDGEAIGVLGCGLNNVQPVSKFDADELLITSRVAGANYFVNDASDPNYGMTLGDICSLDGTYQSLPNQNTTLWYDLDEGTFGSCKSYNVPSNHNVFSPSIVAYENTFDYAEMVGIGHWTKEARRAFVINTTDGYILGCNDGLVSCKTMTADLKSLIGGKLIHIAYLDGGGSCSFERWHNNNWEGVCETERKVPSVVITFKQIDTEPCEDCTLDCEEPDGEGGTAELTEIKALQSKVAELEEDIKKLKEALKSWI